MKIGSKVVEIEEWVPDNPEEYGAEGVGFIHAIIRDDPVPVEGWVVDIHEGWSEEAKINKPIKIKAKFTDGTEGWFDPWQLLEVGG